MSDSIQNLLGLGAIQTNPFPANSRYANTPTATLTASSPRPVGANSDGKQTIFLRRRFVPPPENFALLYEYTVTQGDRPDNLAASLIGDPLQSWQLSDSNGVMRPEELTASPGRKLRVTLPAGIPAQNTQGGSGD